MTAYFEAMEDLQRLDSERELPLLGNHHYQTNDGNLDHTSCCDLGEADVPGGSR
jgi:hypothetical protein